MRDAAREPNATRASSPGGAQRILTLEVVRGVAAAMVLFHHSFAASSPGYEEWTRTFVDPGRVGVVMFFVVSGFVIPLSLDRQSLPVFVVRRLFRLFPVYWVALVLYLLIDPTVRAGDVSVVMWVANVLMVQGLLPIATVIPTAWTLGIEIAFYVQAAVVRKFIERLPPDVLGYAWLAAYTVAMLGQGLLGRPLPATGPLLLFTAAIGHVLYCVQYRKFSRTRMWIMTICGLAIVPFAALLGGRVDQDWPPFVYSVSWVVGILAFRIVIAIGKFFSQPIAIFLGNTSYGVYLFHPLAHHLLEDSLRSVAALILATCVGTYVLSFFLHRLVEAPLIEVGRRVASTRPRVPPAAEA